MLSYNPPDYCQIDQETLNMYPTISFLELKRFHEQRSIKK